MLSARYNQTVVSNGEKSLTSVPSVTDDADIQGVLGEGDRRRGSAGNVADDATGAPTGVRRVPAVLAAAHAGNVVASGDCAFTSGDAAKDARDGVSPLVLTGTSGTCNPVSATWHGGNVADRLTAVTAVADLANVDGVLASSEDDLARGRRRSAAAMDVPDGASVAAVGAGRVGA